MTYEDVEAKSRHKLGIVAYISIFYILSVIIALVLQNVYIEMYTIDPDILQTIISSGKYAYYLEIFPVTTIQVIQMLSIGNFLTYVALFISLVMILKKDLLEDFKIFTKDNIKKNVIKFLIYTTLFFVVNYSMNFVVTILKDLISFESSSSNQEFIEISLQHSSFFMLLSVILLGPVTEELIFRKCIFGVFGKKILSLIISSLIFGSIHIISSLTLGYNVIEILLLAIPYIGAGFLIGFIYMKTDYNIYFVTIIHILSNLISVLFILFF